jgi:hypothetical protein
MYCAVTELVYLPLLGSSRIVDSNEFLRLKTQAEAGKLVKAVAAVPITPYSSAQLAL